jgi:hypothetical protein
MERASGVIILNDPETNYPIAVMDILCNCLSPISPHPMIVKSLNPFLAKCLAAITETAADFRY